MEKTLMPDAKFYMGCRDTRWDVYPQREPEEVVAYDWYGFWLPMTDGSGRWFKSPTSFVLAREITKVEAEALVATVRRPAGAVVLPQRS